MNPKLSIIVTTFNRSCLLKKALLSLACQTAAVDSFEIIVVDDGSTDETLDIVESLASFLPLTYTHQINSGLASAKNHGLYLAKGEIVLFLDDDDISSPELVEEHLIAHQEHPELNTAILGRTQLSPELRDDPLMQYITNKDPMLFFYKGLSHNTIQNYEYFWGGRSSCKRELLLKEGVFNPIFKFGYEDIELGYRLSKKVGLNVVYWEHALNTMIRRIDLAAFLQRCRRQGESAWRFLVLHEMDNTIKNYLECNNLLRDLEILGPSYELASLSATKLEAAVHSAKALDFSLPSDWTKALELAYHRAFRAAISKGMLDAKHRLEPGKSL